MNNVVEDAIENQEKLLDFINRAKLEYIRQALVKSKGASKPAAKLAGVTVQMVTSVARVAGLKHF